MGGVNKDSIIVIAWPDKRVNLTPETKWVEKTGFMEAEDGTIKAGHAGAILVNATSGATKYYDYGRYGDDKNKGIVRCSATDPLSVPDASIDKNGSINNLASILKKIAEKFADYGRMIASVCKGVNYTKMYGFAEDLRRKNPSPYGPFKPGGSNCARFVADLIVAGDPKLAVRLDVRANVTPSPKGNVKNADTEETIYTVEGGKLTSAPRRRWPKSIGQRL